MNMLTGPWNSNAFFNILRGAASDKESRGTLRIMCDLLYDDICHDRGYTSLDKGSPEHMDMVFGGLVSTPILARRGPRVRLLRWFAWFRRAREFQKHLHELLAVLLTVGLKRKWWKNIAETPLYSSRHLEEVDYDCEGDAAEQLEPSAAVEQVPGPDDQGVANALGHWRETMKGSTEDLKRIRSTCKNGMHFAAQVTANRVQCRLFRMISLVFEPIVEWFDLDLTKSKTQRGVQESRQELCLRGLDRVLEKVLATLYSPVALLELSFAAGEPELVAGQREEDRNIAMSMMSLVVNVLSNFQLEAMASQASLPKYFYLLSHPSSAVVSSALLKLQSWWATWCTLERQALSNPAVAGFLDNLFWTRLVWVREVMVELAEYDFQIVPAHLHEELLAFSVALPGTKLVEDVIGDVKGTAGSSSSGRISDASRWKACQVSNRLVENDRPSCTVTGTARAVATGTVPAENFRTDPDFDKLSLDFDILQTLAEDPASWPTPSAPARQLVPCAWSLAILYEGDWGKMRHAWLSLLAGKGTILHRKGKRGTWLVVTVTQYGLVLRTLRFLKSPTTGNLFCIPAPADAEGSNVLQFIAITSLDEGWRACSAIAKPPGELPVDLQAAWHGISFEPSGHGRPLLQCAADDGFRQLTGAFLKKLIAHMGLRFGPGMYPKTVNDMVAALMKHLDPNTSEQDVAQAMARRVSNRTAYGAHVTDCSILLDNIDLVDGMLEEEDKEMAHEVAAKVKAKRERQAAAISSKPKAAPKPIEAPLQPDVQGAASIAPEGEALQGQASSSSSVSPSPDEQQQPKRRVLFEHDDVDVAEARKYAAPGTILQKDTKRFFRWSASLPAKPCPPTHSTKAWGARTSLSSKAALLHVLRTTWAWHEELTGTQCPYSFE